MVTREAEDNAYADVCVGGGGGGFCFLKVHFVSLRLPLQQ